MRAESPDCGNFRLDGNLLAEQFQAFLAVQYDSTEGSLRLKTDKNKMILLVYLFLVLLF